MNMAARPKVKQKKNKKKKKRKEAHSEILQQYENPSKKSRTKRAITSTQKQFPLTNTHQVSALGMIQCEKNDSEVALSLELPNILCDLPREKVVLKILLNVFHIMQVFILKQIQLSYKTRRSYITSDSLTYCIIGIANNQSRRKSEEKACFSISSFFCYNEN